MEIILRLCAQTAHQTGMLYSDNDLRGMAFYSGLHSIRSEICCQVSIYEEPCTCKFAEADIVQMLCAGNIAQSTHVRVRMFYY